MVRLSLCKSFYLEIFDDFFMSEKLDKKKSSKIFKLENFA